MIINKSGIVIRLAVANLRVMGRATQGVKLINLREGDSIAAIEYIEVTDSEEDEVISPEDQDKNNSESEENGRKFEE